MIRSCPDRTSQGTVSQRVEEPDEGQAAGGNAEATPPRGQKVDKGLRGTRGWRPQLNQPEDGGWGVGLAEAHGLLVQC